MSYIQQARVAVKPAGPAQAAEAQFGLLRRGRIEAPDEGAAETPPSRRAAPSARTARSLPTEGREEPCGAGAERGATSIFRGDRQPVTNRNNVEGGLAQHALPLGPVPVHEEPPDGGAEHGAGDDV